MQEMIVIFLIILLLFGAKKIPELARGIGKGMGEFKKAKTDFEDEIKRGETEGEKNWDADSKPVAKTEPKIEPKIEVKNSDEKIADTAVTPASASIERDDKPV